jgi:hypothetical protein
LGDHDKRAELPNGVSGHLLAEKNVERLGAFARGKEID